MLTMESLNKKFVVPDDYVFIIDIRSINNTIINESVQDMRRALIENASVMSDRSTDSAQMIISNISKNIRSNFFFYLNKGIRVFLNVEVPVCLFNYKKRLMEEIKKISEETNSLIFLRIGRDEKKKEHLKETKSESKTNAELIFGSLEGLGFENEDFKYQNRGQELFDGFQIKKDHERGKSMRDEVTHCSCVKNIDSDRSENNCECVRYVEKEDSFSGLEFGADSMAHDSGPNNGSEFRKLAMSTNFDNDHLNEKNKNECLYDGESLTNNGQLIDTQKRESSEKRPASPCPDIHSFYLDPRSEANQMSSNMQEKRSTQIEKKAGDTKTTRIRASANNNQSSTPIQDNLQEESEITIQINGRWKESAIARLKILKFIENCFGNDLKFINCEQAYFNLERSRRYYYGTKINYKLAILENPSDGEAISKRNSSEEKYFFDMDTVKLFYLFYYHKKQIEDVLCSNHSFFETSEINNTSTTVKLTGQGHKTVQKSIMGMTEDVLKLRIADVPYKMPNTFVFRADDRSIVVGKKPCIIELLNHKDIYCDVQIELSKELEDFLCGKKNGKINRIIKETGTKINIFVSNVMTIYISGQSKNVSSAITVIENEFPEELAFYLSERHHKRIIGFGGKNIQRIMKKHGVYIKFMSEYERIQNNYTGNVVVKTPRKNIDALERMKKEILLLADERENKKEIVQVRTTLFEFYVFFVVRSVKYKMLFDEVILSFNRGSDAFLFKDFFFEIEKTPFENLLAESEKESKIGDSAACEIKVVEESDPLIQREKNETDSQCGKDGKILSCTKETEALTAESSIHLNPAFSDVHYGNDIANFNADERARQNTPEEKNSVRVSEVNDMLASNEEEKMKSNTNDLGADARNQKMTGNNLGSISVSFGSEEVDSNQTIDYHNKTPTLFNDENERFHEGWSKVQPQNMEDNLFQHEKNINLAKGSKSIEDHLDISNTTNTHETIKDEFTGRRNDIVNANYNRVKIYERKAKNTSLENNVQDIIIQTKTTPFTPASYLSEPNQKSTGLNGNKHSALGIKDFNEDIASNSIIDEHDRAGAIINLTGGLSISERSANTRSSQEQGYEKGYFSLDEVGSANDKNKESEYSRSKAGGSESIDLLSNNEKRQNENFTTTVTEGSTDYFCSKSVNNIGLSNQTNSGIARAHNISTVSLSDISTGCMIRDIHNMFGPNNAKEEFFFDILGEKERLIKKISPFYFQVGKNYKCSHTFAHTITLKDGSIFLRSFGLIEQRFDGINSLLNVNALNWYEKRKSTFKIFHSQLFYSYENFLDDNGMNHDANSSEDGPKIGTLLTVGFERGKKRSSMK